MPAVIAVAGLTHSWLGGWPSRRLIAVGGLLVFGITLAVSLYKRSHNRETSWGSVRVLPDPPGAETEPVNPLSPDVLFVVGAVLFMLIAVFLPYFQS